MHSIKTARLAIEPMTMKELRSLIERTKNYDSELGEAYTQMLEGCQTHPEETLWYTAWKISLLETGEMVGDLCFKGLPDGGNPEIGYGILDVYQKNGYATEAVRALCQWALSQKGIYVVEAETAPDNVASQRVLEKIGFLPAGTVGEEGPRFILRECL